MKNKIHNPVSIAPPMAPFNHGIEVGPNARWLYISGQVGIAPDGSVPDNIISQCEIVWANLAEILHSAGMDKNDLVKLNVYLTNESDLPAFRITRDKFLEGARPATTLLIIKALARPEWLLEIEGIAAKI